jgi:hypothetical protein
MKILLIVALLLAATTANAVEISDPLAGKTARDAIADCAADFAQFKITATNMLPPAQRDRMKSLELISGEPFFAPQYQTPLAIGPLHVLSPPVISTDRLEGLANSFDMTIKVRCDQDPDMNAMIMAHEVGHIVGYILGLQPDDEYHANVFGAEILFQSGRDSSRALKQVDAACARGNEITCKMADAWRRGLIGG